MGRLLEIKEFHCDEDEHFDGEIYRKLSDEELEKEVNWFNHLWDK